MQTRLQINVGVPDHAVPTVEGCLKGDSRKFDSIPNAIRIHEWLRGTETTLPVLEAVVPNKDGTIERKMLGVPPMTIFPERWFPGQILRLEQLLIAMPEIQRVMSESIIRASETKDQQEIETVLGTAEALMEKVFRLYHFNASAMFFGHEIPVRFFMEDLVTLDALVCFVKIQRTKQVYVNPNSDEQMPIPKEMYSVAELDIVISRLHNANLEGYFPHPETQSKADNLMDVEFYKQCAMAYSAMAGVSIPLAYMETKTTKVYYWALGVLNSLREEIHDLRVRPKPLKVVSLIRK